MSLYTSYLFKKHSTFYFLCSQSFYTSRYGFIPTYFGTNLFHLLLFVNTYCQQNEQTPSEPVCRSHAAFLQSSAPLQEIPSGRIYARAFLSSIYCISAFGAVRPRHSAPPPAACSSHFSAYTSTHGLTHTHKNTHSDTHCLSHPHRG